MPLLHRQMIEVLGIKNASSRVPIDDEAMPTDPVQENQDLLTMKPVKAFIKQNHDGAYPSSHGCDTETRRSAVDADEPTSAGDHGRSDGAHQRAHCVRVPQTS
jgi:hypothetical protein